MKTIYLFIALSLILLNVNAQNTKPDTTNINIGDKQIIVIDASPGDDSTDVAMTPDEDDSDSKGTLTHWDGIDMGVNVLLNKDNKTTLAEKDQWLDLDYAHSLSWRFNIIEEKIRIYKDYAGIIIGAGLTYNSYGLKRNVDITSDSTSATVGVAVADSTRDFSKNKLRASYINVPLMLEFNTSADNDKSFHIAAGVIGGWKMGSIIKQKWDDGDDKNSYRRKADFNMSPFTFDLTARVGYKNFTVFATYGLTPLFKKDKGPEVYPMTVGLQIVPF
jgi:hypothetical protein